MEDRLTAEETGLLAGWRQLGPLERAALQRLIGCSMADEGFVQTWIWLREQRRGDPVLNLINALTEMALLLRKLIRQVRGQNRHLDAHLAVALAALEAANSMVKDFPVCGPRAQC